jgi:chlorobactene lauroyltransferase
MIRANKSKIFENIFSVYNTRLLKKHFYRIHLGGEKNLESWEKTKPSIIYANHSNWWDGLAAIYLSEDLWNIDAYFMMDVEQLKKYRFFKWIGAFSVNRSSPRESMESVKYTINILKNTNKVLWIFPQGIMQPNDYRPIKFYNGISKIAESIGEFNLIPVTFRYEFMMEQLPELFMGIGEVKHINHIEDTKQFTEELNIQLVSELDKLKEKVINSDTGDFTVILSGKKSRNKTIDRLYGE